MRDPSCQRGSIIDEKGSFEREWARATKGSLRRGALHPANSDWAPAEAVSHAPQRDTTAGLCGVPWPCLDAMIQPTDAGVDAAGGQAKIQGTPNSRDVDGTMDSGQVCLPLIAPPLIFITMSLLWAARGTALQITLLFFASLRRAFSFTGSYGSSLTPRSLLASLSGSKHISMRPTKRLPTGATTRGRLKCQTGPISSAGCYEQQRVISDQSPQTAGFQRTLRLARFWNSLDASVTDPSSWLTRCVAIVMQAVPNGRLPSDAGGCFPVTSTLGVTPVTIQSLILTKMATTASLGLAIIATPDSTSGENRPQRLLTPASLDSPCQETQTISSTNSGSLIGITITNSGAFNGQKAVG
ncbi:hypothetical protein CCM_08387 [Cordyceps militaris CM01]|uniref:Uncharacterized protein n=1 Tax=Cordyceps militaris (strain CM01) TaxID=983644 RepID=G3JR48_CORMM|nr:uncharacterized protein CCM_08387 [Cordyceps militaris CM01]EGX88344.1 hypothetical protein CCM_08387 [Cordyceps militaris CM01]